MVVAYPQEAGCDLDVQGLKYCLRVKSQNPNNQRKKS
jgi:hypothetical protein